MLVARRIKAIYLWVFVWLLYFGGFGLTMGLTRRWHPNSQEHAGDFAAGFVWPVALPALVAYRIATTHEDLE